MQAAEVVSLHHAYCSAGDRDTADCALVDLVTCWTITTRPTQPALKVKWAAASRGPGQQRRACQTLRSLCMFSFVSDLCALPFLQEAEVLQPTEPALGAELQVKMQGSREALVRENVDGL